MPHQIAGLTVRDGPMVRDARDAAEGVVGIVTAMPRRAGQRPPSRLGRRSPRPRREQYCELHGAGRPLHSRMDSQHCRRVMPVCCMHTRTGDSSVGSGVSVGPVVTVGLGMSPWLSNQTAAPAVCRVEHYAVDPSAVVPVLPGGDQLRRSRRPAGRMATVLWSWSPPSASRIEMFRGGRRGETVFAVPMCSGARRVRT